MGRAALIIISVLCLLHSVAFAAAVSFLKASSVFQIFQKPGTLKLELVGFPSSKKLKERFHFTQDHVEVIEQEWNSSAFCGDVIVFNLKKEATGNEALRKIQSVFDQTVKVKKRIRVIFVCEDLVGRWQQEMQVLLRAMAHNAAAALPDSSLLQIHWCRELDESCVSLVAESMKHVSRTPLRNLHVATRIPSTRSASSSLNAKTFYDVETLVDSFSSLLRRELVEVDFRSTATNMSLTREFLWEAIDNANSFHHAKHVDIFDELFGSVAMSFAGQRCRLALFQALSALKHTLVDALDQNLLNSFEKQMRRLSDGVRLNAALNELVDVAMQRYRNALEGIHTVIHEMLDVALPEGILSVAYSASNRVFFDASFHARIMEVTLRAAANRRMKEMCLDGKHNPFIRSSSLPPTHLNINYLFNPLAVIDNVELNRLYDEHKPGFANRRADPLSFSGVAAIPFDPNNHPVVKDSHVSLWQFLKNYFSER